ncbi:MAG: leucyl aminopeptidase [Planctomycetota bacterium]|jgi:leucyl aminopeptidase
MKEIIKVQLKTRNVDIAQCKTDLLAVGLFSDSGKLDKITKALDKKLGGTIDRLIKLGDFKAKAGSSSVVYSDGKIPAKRILLVGLGEKKKVDLDTVRKSAIIAASKAVQIKAKTLSLAMHASLPNRLGLEKVGQAIAEGVHLGSYQYDEYITENKDGRLSQLKAEVIDSDSAKIKCLKKGLASGTIIGQGQSYARTIANRPGNVINPVTLAAEARKMSRGLKNLSCTIFNEKQLKEKSMGGILAVGSGSSSEPRLIILKYKPTSKKAASLPTVALVGKAVTFDSGGISIKPSANMDQMKFDKSGGIAVLAAMKAVAELQLDINVFGIIPAAENMPGGGSYRPGDIITTYSGKTVEIQNTDAEGRMILCDGIDYAVKQKCDYIIDVATLTGACMVALGKYKAGLMSNDDELIKALEKASKDSGEKVWHMPCGDEYAEEMKSKIADLKNIGSRWGGACSAAAFLRQFAGETKWAHLDIAGVDMFEAKSGISAPGSSGFGVRLLVSYLVNVINN